MIVPARGTGGATDRRFAVGIARAFGGALFFSLPLLMTMEMWWLGFYMSRARLALFLVLVLPLLIGLSVYSGFEETEGLRDDVLDALAAFGIGVVCATVILVLFRAIGPGMSWDEVIGKVALQAVPGSIGAVLARSELGGDEDETGEERDDSYGAELFLMLAGSLFFAFNIAPTEEITLLAVKMTTWQVLSVAALSLIVMHTFVHSLEFHGHHAVPEGGSELAAFARFSVVGYVLALAVSAYVLWTFGRMDGAAAPHAVTLVVLLGFPASLGAAAARLVI